MLACAISVMIVLLDNLLNIVKKLLGDERWKVCLIGSRACFYKSVVDRVCQYVLGGFSTDRFTTS